jgi:hypothetical protein
VEVRLGFCHVDAHAKPGADTDTNSNACTIGHAIGNCADHIDPTSIAQLNSNRQPDTTIFPHSDRWLGLLNLDGRSGRSRSRRRFLDPLEWEKPEKCSIIGR